MDLRCRKRIYRYHTGSNRNESLAVHTIRGHRAALVRPEDECYGPKAIGQQPVAQRGESVISPGHRPSGRMANEV
jgi:hypothetical protein